MANHVVRKKKLGVPLSCCDVFILLEKKNIIPKALSESLQSMVDFRNIAVHDYASLNLVVVHQIIAKHLQELQEFCRVLIKTMH